MPIAEAGPDRDRNGADGSPLVSVILPVYNGESFVGQAIESALSQTWRNLEIILVDDGSTDRTLSVLEVYAARDPRVRITRQSNGGVASARNRGLAEARGEFIAPLDADDLWEPTKIEQQVRRMLEEGEETGLVYCWWVWIDESGTVLDRSPRWRVEGDIVETLLQVNCTGNASVPLYRRRCIEDAGGYDETLEQQNARGCEDWDVALKVAAHYRVAVVPALLVGYRRLPQSMSTQCDVMWKSQSLVTEELCRRNSDLSTALLRRSADQFALYIAGVSFRSGAYWKAFLWTLRAWHSGLLFRVLPYICLVLARCLIRRVQARPEVMRPGSPLDDARVPEALIPYDRLYTGDSWSNFDASRRPEQQIGAPQSGMWAKLRGSLEGGPLSSAPRVRQQVETCLGSRLCQGLSILFVFFLIAGLNAGNDGLWFQGDAPRHAANGLFWWDVIATHPVALRDFALRYYARYPIINPIAYPPLFYLLEGIAFRLISPSPLVARFVVLAFGMLAGFYTMAWARRWVGPQAGWTGAFLALTPGVVLWTNAVMLNVPAMALGIVCLYHWRRWTESGRAKQLAAAACSAMAAVMMYYQGGIAVLICLVWLVLFRRNSHAGWRTLGWVAVAAVAAVGLIVAAERLAPPLVARFLPDSSFLVSSTAWTFYAGKLPELPGRAALLLGLGGVAAGLLMRRWRTEAAWLIVWMATPIVTFSVLRGTDSRYIMLVTPAFLIAAAIGIAAIAAWMPVLSAEWRTVLLLAGIAAGIWSATRVRVPSEAGFREAANYLHEQAPAEPVLYDGYHDGVIGFYIRARDPRFEGRLILGQQLLYHYGPSTSFDYIETSRAVSTDDVVRLVQGSGCRFIAIEIGSHSTWARSQRLLRESVGRPEFRLVRSFPVTSATAQRIDVYRFLSPGPPVATVDLQLPSYSNRVFAHVGAHHQMNQRGGLNP